MVDRINIRISNLGGDSGIGRAVALAFAREGASIVISYLNETEDAEEIQKIIQNEGHECILIVSLFSLNNIEHFNPFSISRVTSVKMHNVKKLLIKRSLDSNVLIFS